MAISLEEVKEAYIKLKTHVYYDNTDILLRRKLVEFESNRTKDILSIINSGPAPYGKDINVFEQESSQSVEQKLEIFTKWVNSHHEDSTFFDHFLGLINVLIYSKGLRQEAVEDNFISNKRVKNKYEIDRVTAFIDAPVELHLISVLWILKFGKDLDRDLGDHCLGNRLLLNSEKDNVVRGSSLFKPYFKQYQKWRDDSVKIAQDYLNQQKNILFLNFDIRDYFHSVRIPTKKLLAEAPNEDQAVVNLKKIFLEIHRIYTLKIGNDFEVPYNFLEKLERDKSGVIKQIILPIGLLSSYILANDYLKKFDTSILQKVKPIYYGRYVDDILIVIAEPKSNHSKEEEIQQLDFSFPEYKDKVNKNKNRLAEKVSFEEQDLTELERFVLANFYPVLMLIDAPNPIKSISHATGNNNIEKVFKLGDYPDLYCQSKKSLGYFFDKEESDLVIDKLKKELDKRTSEFRDFPEDNESDDSFEESAYHLEYDGSDGKIRTLKDYKENRYGLTVYLANKIFSALRHEKRISEVEVSQVLKFFRGENCLEFYRLWERIFTFLLVNDHPQAYVKFFCHCLEQIEKITGIVPSTKVTACEIQKTFFEYLDCAHEISLSLNPKFIKKAHVAARDFDFQLTKLKSASATLFWLEFEPTKADSFWVRRFRETNMIRHHYVIHPLLNYTKKSKTDDLDLTALIFSPEEYELDDELVANSPRPVKFWESTIATAFKELNNFSLTEIKQNGIYASVDLFAIKKNRNSDPLMQIDTTFYLDDAFELYKRLNENHIPEYKQEEFRQSFFSRKYEELQFDKINSVGVQEITVDSSHRLSQPRISFANTEVEERNIISSIRGTPNLDLIRYQKLARILKAVREEKVDILLFPEFFIPINLLSSLVRFSEKNCMLTVTGLEHVTVNKTSFNFIVTILPLETNGIKDAVVIFRLKNHYAHIEELLIDGNHCVVPKPISYRYDIFNWKNIYFSTYYCFELANSLHRSLMKGKIDLLIGVEWNRDTPYFSNIVEAVSRDLHLYVAQVNTSQFGDTRLTQPVETARKDILRLKGGINDSILVASIDIPKLREFQRKKFALSHVEKEFKPLPPDYKLEDVMKRINNQEVL